MGAASENRGDASRMRNLRRDLTRLGLSHWIGPLADWLARYRGLERRTFGEARPAADICARVRELAGMHARLTNEQFAGEVAVCAFLYWRAADGAGRMWDPLGVELEAFCRPLGPFELRLWCSDEMRPAPAEVAAWLLARHRMAMEAGDE